MKTGDLIKKIVFHRYVALIFRLYIGWVFIYASMSKINYAGEFAETIASYQLVPFWTVNVMAVFMPWAELICGLLLVAGVRSKAAAISIMAMLIMFIFAIGITLIRDIPIGCGCFHALEEPMDWSTLLRDIVWLLMTVHVYLFDSALQLEKKFLMKIKDV